MLLHDPPFSEIDNRLMCPSASLKQVYVAPRLPSLESQLSQETSLFAHPVENACQILLRLATHESLVTTSDQLYH